MNVCIKHINELNYNYNYIFPYKYPYLAYATKNITSYLISSVDVGYDSLLISKYIHLNDENIE